MALCACALVRAQVIATDNAEHSAYTVNATYNAINGGTGAWDPAGWVAEGWEAGDRPLVKAVSPSLNMGTQVFTTNAAVGGGADSKRKLQSGIPIGSTVTWRMMIDPACSAGEFYLDVRSGQPGSSGQRDMLLLIGEVGANWRVYAKYGGIEMSTLFSTPFTLGERVDGSMTITGLNTWQMTLTPFGGSPSTISGEFRTTDQLVQVLNFSNFGLNGDAYFNNISVNGPAPANQTLTGNLILGDTAFSGASTRNIAYTVMQGTTTLASGSVTASASSSALSIDVPASATGAAELVLDGSSFLKRVVSINLTGSNQAIGNATMQNGDVDGTGEVDAADIDQVIAAFGNMGDNVEDVDVSDEVDAADIDIVIANFGGMDD